jgi:hypothetical protein
MANFENIMNTAYILAALVVIAIALTIIAVKKK